MANAPRPKSSGSKGRSREGNKLLFWAAIVGGAVIICAIGLYVLMSVMGHSRGNRAITAVLEQTHTAFAPLQTDPGEDRARLAAIDAATRQVMSANLQDVPADFRTAYLYFQGTCQIMDSVADHNPGELPAMMGPLAAVLQADAAPADASGSVGPYTVGEVHKAWSRVQDVATQHGVADQN